MFESVRNNPRIVQGLLLLIIVPFAFWGAGSLRESGGADAVATVGKSKITPQQFQEAVREQTERMRNSLGPQFDPAMMSTPEARTAVLENLINQRLLMAYAADAHIGVSNEQLAQTIQSIPALRGDDGKFSAERFEQIASAQGLSKQGLEQRLRQDMSTRMAIMPIVVGAVVSHAGGDAWLSAALQEREISEMALKPDAYLSKVNLDKNAVSNFYESNKSRFSVPEQLRYEYVVLNQQAFAAKAEVSDADIKAWYDAHQDSYKQAEERHASHILIQVDKGAKPDVVQAAENKAKDILAQVKKNPADFAKLAKQYSQDPGSAAAGGDLGVVARGVMVKPFEDAVFALKDGQISDLVRTDFGFHIIRLTGLKAERIKPLAEVKADIASELKAQTATKKYAEAADGFTNTVYEQADSLKPAADKFGLQIQQGTWIAKGRPAPGLNEKLVTALFSTDAIDSKHNTEAIEVAPNTLMSARVVEHKAATVLPLEQVQTQIEAKLKRDEAAKLAAADAEARLAKLNAGDAGAATWSNTRSVARAGATGITGPALRAVFALKTDKLPAYTSASSLDGTTTLYRISKLSPYVPAEKDDQKAAALRQQYAQLVSEADFTAWLNSLRERYKVTINQSALTTKASAE